MCTLFNSKSNLQDRNQAELERFEDERSRDFMNMLRGLIQTQVRR